MTSREGTSPPAESADRRTELAANRTVLAAERTYAAWVRTGLAALASGVGAHALLKGIIPAWSVRSVGTVLILFSAFSFAAGIWRELKPGAAPPRPDVRRLPAALLLIVNGILCTTALAVLVGIWLAQD